MWSGMVKHQLQIADHVTKSVDLTAIFSTPGNEIRYFLYSNLKILIIKHRVSWEKEIGDICFPMGTRQISNTDSRILARDFSQPLERAFITWGVSLFNLTSRVLMFYILNYIHIFRCLQHQPNHGDCWKGWTIPPSTHKIFSSSQSWCSLMKHSTFHYNHWCYHNNNSVIS